MTATLRPARLFSTCLCGRRDDSRAPCNNEFLRRLLRHQRRLASSEEAAQDSYGQWAFARRLHGLGRGLDGFEQVRVLTFLLLRAMRVVGVMRAMRVGMAVGHFVALAVLVVVLGAEVRFALRQLSLLLL